MLLKYVNVKDREDLSKLEEQFSLYVECSQENYHDGEIVGIALSDSKNNYFISNSVLEEVGDILKDKTIYTFDQKKNFVLLHHLYNH